MALTSETHGAGVGLGHRTADEGYRALPSTWLPGHWQWPAPNLGAKRNYIHSEGEVPGVGGWNPAHTQTPFPAAASSSQVSAFLHWRHASLVFPEKDGEAGSWCSLIPLPFSRDWCQRYRQLECQSQKISEIRPSSSFQTLASDCTGQTAACRSIKVRKLRLLPLGARGQEPQVCVQGQPLRWLNGGLGIWLGNQIQSKPVFCSTDPIVQAARWVIQGRRVRGAEGPRTGLRFLAVRSQGHSGA